MKEQAVFQVRLLVAVALVVLLFVAWLVPFLKTSFGMYSYLHRRFFQYRLQGFHPQIDLHVAQEASFSLEVD